LARAALRELQRIIEDLELRSGLSRKTASSFVTHQPNPRIVETLARQLGVPVEKFPPVAKTSGNLGSSTCGVALAMALDEHGDKSPDHRGPIFLAAVGPGLLWGGGMLY
jgi:3-oxoacyl-[acyl-carrier-protein] synthase III